jgi:hypothetical protein
VAPEYLDGSLPGDYGFDPLGLGADKEWLAWFQQAELMHCRWAMIGAAGILLPDLASTVRYPKSRAVHLCRIACHCHTPLHAEPHVTLH